MQKYRKITLVALFLAFGVPLLLTEPVLAADGMEQMENFFNGAARLLTIIASSIAVLMFIIGGIIYILSGNNAETLSGAKRTLMNTAVGIGIVFAAFAIVGILVELSSSSFSQ